MQITYMNYKQMLPESLHDKFRLMIDRAYGRVVIFKNNILRYANVDEEY